MRASQLNRRSRSRSRDRPLVSLPRILSAAPAGTQGGIRRIGNWTKLLFLVAFASVVWTWRGILSDGVGGTAATVVDQDRHDDERSSSPPLPEAGGKRPPRAKGGPVKNGGGGDDDDDESGDGGDGGGDDRKLRRRRRHDEEYEEMNSGGGLLDEYAAAARSLPPCPAVRLSLSSFEDEEVEGEEGEDGGEEKEEGAGGSIFDPSRPAIFAGWGDSRPGDVSNGRDDSAAPALARWSDREAFASRFGGHPQYIKDGDDQPFRDGAGRRCTSSTAGLLRAMEERNRAAAVGEGRGGGGEEGVRRRLQGEKMQRKRQLEPKRAKQQRQQQQEESRHSPREGRAEGGRDLLFFTNDVENPTFFDSLGEDYDIPPPLSDIPSFYGTGGRRGKEEGKKAERGEGGREEDKGKEGGGFRIFSAMERGSSHSFQEHEPAWLGQISGSRLWYFGEPGAFGKGRAFPRPGKVNGCDYLTGDAPLPGGEGTIGACVQRRGEVMYLPPGWWHSTCALEDWSVGVGGQGGRLKSDKQEFGDELGDVGGGSGVVVPLPPPWEEERKKFVMCGALDDGVRDAGEEAVESDPPRLPSSKSTTVIGENSDENGGNRAPVATDDTEVQSQNQTQNEWKWFDGDLNEYYNKLERDEHAKRKPDNIATYAVHRALGPTRSTLVHYGLVREAIHDTVLLVAAPPEEGGRSLSQPPPLRVFDAGCGLGAGLMWFEQNEPSWELVGHTISEDQHRWIMNDLPAHKFMARLRSYDEPLGHGGEGKGEEGGAVTKGGVDGRYHAVYSIEAVIHSPDLQRTLQAWSDALVPGGVVVIIDDFLSVGTPREDPEVVLFSKSWIANAVHTTTEIADMASRAGMALVRDRDLGSEYQIAKLNYRNRAPELKDKLGRMHQGWLGSKVRQRLMVLGKIGYRMVVLRKGSGGRKEIKGKELAGGTRYATLVAQARAGENHPQEVREKSRPLGEQGQKSCASVPLVDAGGGGSYSGNTTTLDITIDPVLMSGRGKRGGAQMACISGWYCCDKGTKLWDEMEKTRTGQEAFLQLPRELFGHYLTSFSKHLTEFYRTYPANYPNDGTANKRKGIFLDIGGTGSTAAGMKQVTSKFAHFAGPLEYWVLDSDPAAADLSNAVVCDVDSCPNAPDCAYDVTFSHTVLEHASRPWEAFDTVARITKRGGLTLHLVPWSYQYHATPDDNYRFSHTALRTLLEDRGFDVIDVGYDVCTKPENVLRSRKDEHYDTVWLTWVVGKKR